MAQHVIALFWLKLALLGVCGGGIIPNVLSAVVLIKERNSIPAAWILLGLAVADGGLLLATVSLVGVEWWDEKFRNYEDGRPWVILIPFNSLYEWMQMAGIYLVIALAAGRYIAVSKPHLAQNWNNKGRQRTIVVVLFTGALLITLATNLAFLRDLIYHHPQVNDFQVSHWTPSSQPHDVNFQHDTLLPNHDSGATFTATTPLAHSFSGSSPGSLASQTDSRTTNSSLSVKSSSLWGFTLPLVCSFVYQYLIPLLCIFMINIRFFRGLHRFQNRRKRFAQTQTEFTSSSQVRVILNVAVILAVFLVCQATSFAMWITWACLVDGDMHPEYYSSNGYVVAQIALFFAALNSATNFWVYLAFMKEFRRVIARLMSCIYCCCSDKQEN